MLTPDEAGEFHCPMTFVDAANPMPCEGPQCILWRWAQLETDDAFLLAVKKEQERLAAEKGSSAIVGFHKTAVKNVMADRKKHGLPDKPTHGWCGLGDKPEPYTY